jgi:hypothetical protein
LNASQTEQLTIDSLKPIYKYQVQYEDGDEEDISRDELELWILPTEVRERERESVRAHEEEGWFNR